MIKGCVFAQKQQISRSLKRAAYFRKTSHFNNPIYYFLSRLLVLILYNKTKCSSFDVSLTTRTSRIQRWHMTEDKNFLLLMLYFWSNVRMQLTGKIFSPVLRNVTSTVAVWDTLKSHIRHILSVRSFISASPWRPLCKHIEISSRYWHVKLRRLHTILLIIYFN